MSTDTNTPRIMRRYCQSPHGLIPCDDGAYTLAEDTLRLETELQAAQAEVARLKESYLKSQSLAAAMLAKSSDELTALRAEIDRLHNIWNNIEHIITERDQLRARVAELEQDKARLEQLTQTKVPHLSFSAYHAARMRDAAKGQP